MTAPGWLETFHDLHAAATVKELWSVLLSWHGIRSSTQWEEPYLLFRKFHAEDPDAALVTAVLLCTDHRWRKATHHLVSRVVGSGLLTDDDVLVLAEWFVAGAVGVEVGATAEDDIEGDFAGVGTIERPVWPPLRRWASAALVEREPGRWRDLLDAAPALPSRDGDALAAGVMDAVSHLPERDRGHALAAGLMWGSGIVRLAALPGYADLEGVDTALSRAAVDPSAKVRSWKPAASSSAATSRAEDRSESHAATRGDAGQASLF